MIRQVSIKNFKCLRDVTVDLQPFTVFVGANGSGKTSVLQAIDLLCRTFRPENGQHGFTPQPGHLEGEYLANRSYGATEEVGISGSLGDKHYRYRATTQPQPPRHPFHTQEQKWSGLGPAFTTTAGLPGWQPWQPQHGTLPNPVWLRLETPRLRQHLGQGQGPGFSFGHGSDPRLMSVDGSGMHTALASMALEDPDEWTKLQDNLRRIVPAVGRLRLTAQSELLFDMVNGKGLKADQVSEGTVLILGLLTAIHGANKPGALLLDDLDRALHPKAQRELIRLLRGVQETNPEIQIAATTHSPYMLDEMRPNEVLVTSLRDDGSTACEPLTRHLKFEKWKDEFHPGEMWSVFGEKWVADGEVVGK